MTIMKARIVWFPNLITSITEDILEDTMEWKADHLKDVRNYMKEDGLLFPIITHKGEIHCGHYRFKVAKEMGFSGIEAYEAESFEHVLYLTKFCETCYMHYKELKNIKNLSHFKNTGKYL